MEIILRSYYKKRMIKIKEKGDVNKKEDKKLH